MENPLTGLLIILIILALVIMTAIAMIFTNNINCKYLKFLIKSEYIIVFMIIVVAICSLPYVF